MVALVLGVAGCQSGGPGPSSQGSTGTTAQKLAADEIRAIAKEAYIYGFPMVDSYRIQHAYFVDKANPEYKGPWNEAHSVARVFTPDDVAVQTPNSDTPYTMLGADLRDEPLVLTVPPIEQNRYYSLQFIDGYTYNFDYVGSRTTGNGGGKYLLAGPNWTGEKPDGIAKVLRSDTDFAFIIYRTQLFNPADLDNVKKIQAQYRVEPLSAFAQKPPAPAAPPVDFIAPLSPEDQKTSPKFFEVLDFVMRYAPTMDSEKDIRARFAKLGIGADGDFNADSLSPEARAAVQDGMKDAWAEFEDFKKTKVDTGQVTSGDILGDKEFLNGNYLYRMAAAVIGIYGNSKQEAMYPILSVDSAGAPLSGADNYTLRFAPGQLPPVNAFWSVTMYKMPESLLVANPINRYLINSPMHSRPEEGSRRGPDPLRAERLAGAGQRSQLAARSQRAVHHDTAPLLAET